MGRDIREMAEFYDSTIDVILTMVKIAAGIILCAIIGIVIGAVFL